MRAGEIVIAGLLLIIGGALGWLTSQQLASQTATQQSLTSGFTTIRTGLDTAAKSMTETASEVKAAAAHMATLTKIMQKPRPVSAENISDAVVAAIMLSHLTDPQIRTTASTILGRLPRQDEADTRAEDRLLVIAEHDTDNNVRRSAMQSLNTMQSKRLLPLITKTLKTGNIEAKNTAAALLSSNATVASLPVILEALKSLRGKNYRTRNARNQLYQALQRIGDRRACKTLAEVITTEGNDYRSTAISALVACATRSELPYLITALEGLKPAQPNRSNRSAESLIKALGEMGDIRATKALLPYLSSANQSLLNITLQTVLSLRDPLAAPKIKTAYAKLLKGSQGSYYARNLTQTFKAGVPGLIYDEKKKTLSVVDKDTLTKLMEKRAKRLKRAIANAKNRPLNDPENEIF